MEKRDFLVIALIGAGSSYARGPDLDDCVKRLGKIIVSDWGSLYDVGGKPCSVNCYDVTGHDSIYWDGRGVHAKVEGSENVTLDRLELRQITLPPNKKKRR
jgi:hypothetical protein